MSNITINITEEMQSEIEAFVANTDPNAILIGASLHTSFASDLQNLLISGPEKSRLTKENLAQILAYIRFQDKVLSKIFDVREDKIERESLNIYMGLKDVMEAAKEKEQEGNARAVEDALHAMQDEVETLKPLQEVMESAIRAVDETKDIIETNETEMRAPFEIVEENGMGCKEIQ